MAMTSPRPLYLRLSVTDRCNLRCGYCRPGKGGDPVDGTGLLSDEEILALLSLVKASLPLYKVRLTGGDPLVRPDLAGLVKKIRLELPMVELGATTNGLLLSRQADALKRAGLDSLNISLDTADAGKFFEISGRDAWSEVNEGIRAAKKAGFRKIKLNAVLLRSINGDNLPGLVRFANDVDCELRLIELMPIGVAAQLFQAEFLSAHEALSILRTHFGDPVPLGLSGTATRYLYSHSGRQIVLGVIQTLSAPFCSTCDRLRIDSRGWLYPCLHDYQGVNLQMLSKSGKIDQAKHAIREAHGKPGEKQPALDWTSRPMIHIGG